MEKVTDDHKTQRLRDEDYDLAVRQARTLAATYASGEGAIVVVANRRADRSYVYPGALVGALALGGGSLFDDIPAVYEHELMAIVNADDRRAKQICELQYFRYIKRRRSQAARYVLLLPLRFRGKSGKYISLMMRLHTLAVDFDGAPLLTLAVYGACPQGSPTATIANTVTGSSVAPGASDAALLTARERQLMTLAARGLSGRDIAAEMGITYGTQKNYRCSIIKKLQVKSLRAAMKLAASIL